MEKDPRDVYKLDAEFLEIASGEIKKMTVTIRELDMLCRFEAEGKIRLLIPKF